MNDSGLGMDVETSPKELLMLRQLFKLLPYTPEVSDTWQHIVIAQGISGKQTHDAHPVARMQVHSVMSILTFNEGHFKRFPGITLLNPAAL
jgi:predicted nucleic acid-binding protein